MRFLRLSLVVSLTVALFTLLTEVQEADSIYAYAIKGLVKDVRLNPTRFVGGWFFKKAFILKKLKLKWKLKKKLILKKLLKKLFLGVALAKLGGGGRGGIKIIAPKIIIPIVPPGIAHGWGPPLKYWTYAPLHLFPKKKHFGRKKRAVRFPDDEDQSQSQQQQYALSSSAHSAAASHNRYSYQDGSQYFQNLNIGSLGLSQTDLEQLRQMPDNLKNEYGHEIQELEAAASEPKEEEIQGYLSMASELDDSACIPRSICEIMARRNRTSSQFENQIFDYYNVPENLERRSGTPAYAYDYAAYLGKSTHDPRSCASYFPNCSEPQALEKFMNEVFAPELCESPFTNSNSNSLDNINSY